MAPVKAAAPRLVRFTTSRSRPQKPMPPNEPLPRSANRSGLSFIGKAARPANLSAVKACGRCCRGDPLRLSPRRYDANSAAIALLWPSSKSTPPQAVVRAASITSAAARSECALPGKIDKSVLALSEPKRRRDKSHLRFVASQPCLVCGRHPSDPHHLRFAQPRALGVKVSDEFTVPLCRGHHRQLHQAGNEVAWWEELKIDALRVARQLWEQTHPNEGQVLSDGSAIRSRGPKRMTTEKQIAANRENAKKSTGPRTLDGKRKSRRNAVRHGLTAETVIDVLEDRGGLRGVSGRDQCRFSAGNEFRDCS